MPNGNASLVKNWVTYTKCLRAGLTEDAAFYLFYRFFPGRALMVATIEELRPHAEESKSVRKVLDYLAKQQA